MPTVQNYIEQLQNLYKPDDVIACHLWQVDDVIGKAEEMEVKVTKEQAEEIIESLHKNVDSEHGITWGTLEFEIEEKIKENE